MDFEGFNSKKLDEYSAQAKALYGKTDAYKEFQKKSGSRTPAREKELGSQVMDFFARLGSMRPVRRIVKRRRLGQRNCRRFSRSITTTAHLRF